MNDTHLEAKKIQQRIYLNMTLQDRYRIAGEMSDALFLFAEADIQNKFPKINSMELKIEKFKRMYKHEFSEDELNRIISAIRKQNESREL